MTPATPREAASLLVLRDAPGGDGPPQIYMVRRHPRSKFMANALVFVGGRFDEADGAPELLARCSGLSAQEAAARLGGGLPPERALGLHVGALRECFEEAGLLLALDEGGAPARQDSELLKAREALNADELSFVELLARHGLTLPLDRLRYLDHWLTPEFEPRRYDTHFFACRAPVGQEATFDPKETSFGGWFSVEQALEQNRANEMWLAPPTLTIIEGLAGAASVEAIFERCPDRPLPPKEPRPLMVRGEAPVLLLPGDHRYEDQGSAQGAEHYVTLTDGHWVRIQREG